MKLHDLEQLVQDGIPESLHLDYKDSRALQKTKLAEITKDVSAFANSDGGRIIYGIEEVNNLPTELDVGVPDSNISREWLDQILAGHITPPIPGIRIFQIEGQAEHSYYVIDAPKSTTAHQAADKKYYKRFEFRSAPMDHYEIEDVRSRRTRHGGLVLLDIVPLDRMFVFQLRNPGDVAALNLRFKFEPEIPWPRGTKLTVFANGLTSLPPGRTMSFYYAPISPQVDEVPPFVVQVIYVNSETDTNVIEDFSFSLSDFLGVRLPEDPDSKLVRVIQESTRAIIQALRSKR